MSAQILTVLANHVSNAALDDKVRQDAAHAYATKLIDMRAGATPQNIHERASLVGEQVSANFLNVAEDASANEWVRYSALQKGMHALYETCVSVATLKETGCELGTAFSAGTRQPLSDAVKSLKIEEAMERVVKIAENENDSAVVRVEAIWSMGILLNAAKKVSHEIDTASFGERLTALSAISANAQIQSSVIQFGIK